MDQDKVSTCKHCGLTIRRFSTVNLKGKSDERWFYLIKGIWTEACPASFLLRKRHKPV